MMNPSRLLSVLVLHVCLAQADLMSSESPAAAFDEFNLLLTDKPVEAAELLYGFTELPPPAKAHVRARLAKISSLGSIERRGDGIVAGSVARLTVVDKTVENADVDFVYVMKDSQGKWRLLVKFDDFTSKMNRLTEEQKQMFEALAIEGAQ